MAQRLLVGKTTQMFFFILASEDVYFLTCLVKLDCSKASIRNNRYDASLAGQVERVNGEIW